MLRSQNRITRREGFGPVLKQGGKAANRVLVVSVRLSEDDSPSRAGIVVGKREFALATRRNRIKRRLRHLLSERLVALPNGTSLVVRALPGAAGLSSEELGASLDAMIRRAMDRAARKGTPSLAPKDPVVV